MSHRVPSIVVGGMRGKHTSFYTVDLKKSYSACHRRLCHCGSTVSVVAFVDGLHSGVTSMQMMTINVSLNARACLFVRSCMSGDMCYYAFKSAV